MVSKLTIEQLENAAVMLKAIAHPTRIAILNQLDNRSPLTVKEIQNALGIEQATTSHHLGILKDKNVLVSKRSGKNIYYSLKDNRINTLIDCISKCACV